MFYAVAPLPLTYVVFYCAKFLPFESINSKNDISYGVYIYGTLILNILAMAGFNYSWFVYVAATYLITFAMAKLSWHLIESPSLRAKNMFS
jgi:peptidoglycan/LPS O-acetylase OafA/YrhL